MTPTAGPGLGGDAVLAAQALVQAQLVATGALGLVQRAIGSVQQRIGTFAIGGEAGQAQGNGDGPQGLAAVADLQARDPETERLAAIDGIFEADLRHHQGELLAAVAAGQVAGAHVALHFERQVAQDQVAGLMPEGVVEALEVVHIQQHDDHRRLLATGTQQFAAQGLVEEAAVVQAGQSVHHRLLAQALTQAEVGHAQGHLFGEGFGQLQVGAPPHRVITPGVRPGPSGHAERPVPGQVTFVQVRADQVLVHVQHQVALPATDGPAVVGLEQLDAAGLPAPSSRPLRERPARGGRGAGNHRSAGTAGRRSG